MCQSPRSAGGRKADGPRREFGSWLMAAGCESPDKGPRCLMQRHWVHNGAERQRRWNSALLLNWTSEQLIRVPGGNSLAGVNLGPRELRGTPGSDGRGSQKKLPGEGDVHN